MREFSHYKNLMLDMLILGMAVMLSEGLALWVMANINVDFIHDVAQGMPFIVTLITLFFIGHRRQDAPLLYFLIIGFALIVAGSIALIMVNANDAIINLAGQIGFPLIVFCIARHTVKAKGYAQ